jgi:hypothetical protein
MLGPREGRGLRSISERKLTLTAGLATALMLSLVVLPTDRASGGVTCGVWRWDVKTLSDPDRRRVDFHAEAVRIGNLRRRDPPDSLDTDTPRLAGVERHVYKVKAQAVTAKIEEDGDIHLVIAARAAKNRTMIVEFPDRACVASAFKRDRMDQARQAMLAECGSLSSSSFTDLTGNVVIRGVGFWDAIHGQTGVAPNGIELHPVLRFEGMCDPATSTTSTTATTTASTTATTTAANCDPAYPTVCIPSPPPDLDCGDIPYTNFSVLPPDPHGFDGDHNGVGCET